MKITINKPCHEDWEKMTPNQQGVFCQVCTKNVVDFTTKTLDEIKAFFARPTEGRVCARFKEEQLEELNAGSFIERFMGWKPARKVAMIVALSFITWLGGSGEMKAQDSNTKKGEGSVELDGSNQQDPYKAKMGMVALVPKDTTKCKKDPKTTNTGTGNSAKKPKNKNKNTTANKTSQKPKEKIIMGDVEPEK